MLLKLLSSLIYLFKRLITYPDYYIVSEELEYKINPDVKFRTEDPFWEEESKDWCDGILTEYFVDVTDKDFRHSFIPQNVELLILHVKYYYNGKLYSSISYDINFKPGVNENEAMHFSIPFNSAWLVDADDKPVKDITEKVKRYSGERGDFHGEKVALEHFLYYDREYLEQYIPKIVLKNTLGMKKVISTLTGFTTDLQIP